MTTYWAVPAGVLGALGEMMKGDPPILWEDDGGVYFWHPLVRFAEPAPGPDDSVLVEQSAPALAAVVARHLGRSVGADDGAGAMLGCGFACHYDIRAPMLYLSHGGWSWGISDGLIDHAVVDDFLALAIVVCHLANKATGSDRFAPREVTL